MDKVFQTIFSLLKTLSVILLLVVAMICMTNYALLRNITTRVTKEAEITGVISSSFINKTYANSPLSKLNGNFQILEVTPGLDNPAEHLGDKMYLKIQKEIYLTPKFKVNITARAYAINQGYYGLGYRSD